METIKVKDDKQEQGFYIINKDDFDPKIHTEYVEGQEPKKQPRKKADNA